MSRFKKAIKKKELESALSKHPLKELDEQVKSDYVKGLVFIATEDENFDEDEKSYITSLMKNIGVDENKLSEYETFASDCEEDELLAFMDRLKAFDEDLKINFMIEVVVIAFKDGEFDEAEQGMFDDYLEMLEITDKKDDIMYLATALTDKNIDLALSFYTAKKEMFEKYDYMFDMLGIDVAKELKELYSWEWVEWRLEKGNIEDDNLVASKPVTVRQCCVFLNSMVISKDIAQIPNTDKFESVEGKKLMIENIANANIDFEDGLFHYDEENKESDFLGATSDFITIFTEWVNEKTENSTKGLRIIANSYEIALGESAQGFLTDNYEQFIAYISWSDRGNNFCFINTSYYNYSEYNRLEANTNYAFRLMKTKEEEN